MTVDDVLNQRQKTHGNFADVAEIAQTIKDAIDTLGSGELSHTHREALDLIATKMARIVSGDPNNIDHWLDIEGYARLVRNILERANG